MRGGGGRAEGERRGWWTGGRGAAELRTLFVLRVDLESVLVELPRGRQVARPPLHTRPHAARRDGESVRLECRAHALPRPREIAAPLLEKAPRRPQRHSGLVLAAHGQHAALQDVARTAQVALLHLQHAPRVEERRMGRRLDHARLEELPRPRRPPLGLGGEGARLPRGAVARAALGRPREE